MNNPLYPCGPYTKLGGIYKLINLVNQKIYIGSATVLRERWYDHVEALRKGTHYNEHMQRAWNTYGEKSFRFVIQEIVSMPTKENLEVKEQYWIDFYQSYNRDKGYNICPTAYTKKGVPSKFKGIPRTEEVKAKIRIAKIGTTQSEESNQKRSETMKGRIFTPEDRIKLALGAERMWKRRKS